MIDIKSWMKTFLDALDVCFGERVWFVGLQGSYGRGEATESSDVDVVVILDELSSPDIQAYEAMLNTLAHRDLVCGFLSGTRELLEWEPSDLFQFYYDTTPIRGDLDDLLPLLDDTAVKRAVKIGSCNLYHACVHNMLHDKSEEILRSLYKSASFVVQAIAFAQTGVYLRTQSELLSAVSAEDGAIVQTAMKLKKGEPVDFDSMSETLFAWSQKHI